MRGPRWGAHAPALLPFVVAFAAGCDGSTATTEKDACAGVSCDVPTRTPEPDACTGVTVGERVPLVLEPPRALPMWAARWRRRVLVLAGEIVTPDVVGTARTRLVELDEAATSVLDDWTPWPNDQVMPGDLAVSDDTLAVLSFASNASGSALVLVLVDLQARAGVGEPRVVLDSLDQQGDAAHALGSRVLPLEGGWLVLWTEHAGMADPAGRSFARRYSQIGEPVGQVIGLTEVGDAVRLRGATSDGKRAIVPVDSRGRQTFLFVDGRGSVHSLAAPEGTTGVTMIRENIVATGSDAWIFDAEGGVVAGPLGHRVRSLGALGTGYVSIEEGDPLPLLGYAQALDRKLVPSSERQELGQLDGLRDPISPLVFEDFTLMLHVSPFASVKLTCAR